MQQAAASLSQHTEQGAGPGPQERGTRGALSLPCIAGTVDSSASLVEWRTGRLVRLGSSYGMCSYMRQAVACRCGTLPSRAAHPGPQGRGSAG